ncbi:MAG: ribose-5-phosphate isomerase RpiA [Chloroflexota bacterium]|nr:ribose-5-phosphate isomerase RpiA [Chloroflexota bacterium]
MLRWSQTAEGYSQVSIDVSSEDQKRQAAERTAALVEDGMSLGLGSGTTAELFVRALAPRVADGLRLRCVATSGRTERLAGELGIPLYELDGELDLAIDGADAIERGTLAAIKGRGGALTREKIVALAARRFILVGDSSKLVDRLSDTLPTLPIPVEVLQFGWKMTRLRLAALGDPVLRARNGAPFITDNGNVVLDLYNAPLARLADLAAAIASVSGVVEHGLFLDIASLAIVGEAEGVLELRRGMPVS